MSSQARCYTEAKPAMIDHSPDGCNRRNEKSAPMSSEKTTAIVLRVVPFSETSSILTLFTRDFGKLGAMAKGARRLKGPFDSALDLLTVCRIVFLRKSTGALDLLTEAKLVRRFRPPGRDLSCLYAGYYVAELLTKMTDEYDPHPRLFDMAESVLKELAEGGAVAPLVLRFEMTALSELGHMPSLELCAECGRKVDWSGRVRFGHLAGGVLCGKCRGGQRKVAVVNSNVLKLMQCYAANDDAWRRAPLEGRTRGELRGIMNHYLSNLLGQEPKMHRYLTAFSS